MAEVSEIDGPMIRKHNDIYNGPMIRKHNDIYNSSPVGRALPALDAYWVGGRWSSVLRILSLSVEPSPY